MPYQIKNGIVYGSNAVSLTQAQYDALSTAEKNNGTVYYIYDAESMLDASDVSLGSGTVEDLAGSVAVIETSPATATHAVGDYIVWNGKLYEVTTAIAVGETLTVGTNITATTVGEKLSAILNSNGATYMKLPDGTAFAWGRVKFGPATTTGFKTATVNFPLTFTNKPAAVVSWYDTDHVHEYFDFVSVLTNSLTASTLAAGANQKQVSNYDWYACYVAVGRWR